MTPHFTLPELTLSQEATRKGMKNIPSARHIINLGKLCNEILEPLRESVAAPISVSSGFRTPEVNEAVGGSRTSDHCDGRAADITIQGLTPLQVAERIVKLDLPFKQVINEFDQWCHVSIPLIGESPKRERLTARKDVQGKTFYLRGLV